MDLDIPIDPDPLTRYDPQQLAAEQRHVPLHLLYAWI